MTKTGNYNLNKPEPTDPLRLADFNENADIIDAALAAVPSFVTGTYTGDGTTNRTIELGFTPKAVFVCNNQGATAHVGSSVSWMIYGGLALPDCPVQRSGKKALSIVSGGFQVTYYSDAALRICTNLSDSVFYYVALR